MTEPRVNADAQELWKFDEDASRWWDPEGDYKPLHRLNPLRLDAIAHRIGGFEGRRILDIGCGGGLLSEGMAERGASVTGIDLAEASLGVARQHAEDNDVAVAYRAISAEDLAEESAGTFDAVTCLEMLEHVPDPASVVAACARLARPGGDVFFSTLNRTAKSWLFAIVGAEYVLRLLPRGTHDHSQFIRPSELDGWCRGVALDCQERRGIIYNPITGNFHLGDDVAVNYLAHYRLATE